MTIGCRQKLHGIGTITSSEMEKLHAVATTITSDLDKSRGIGTITALHVESALSKPETVKSEPK